MVVHSRDGLDEISVSDKTDYILLNQGRCVEGCIDPKDIIGKIYPIEEVLGGEAEENADIMKEILGNKLKGAKRDIICLNAVAALFVAGKADSVEKGYQTANQLISDKKAWDILQKWIKCSQQF